MALPLEDIAYFWTLVALGCTYITYTLLRFGSREKHLPPGPPTYPIIGNAHLVVDKDLYKKSLIPIFPLFPPTYLTFP
jgi:hypothetical protein